MAHTAIYSKTPVAGVSGYFDLRILISAADAIHAFDAGETVVLAVTGERCTAELEALKAFGYTPKEIKF